MFERNTSATIGVFGTVAYFFFLLYIIFIDWSDFRGLKPNEWGDFLAGSLGPLAIFWLIISFFQQSHELRNSVEALKLQAEELRNSVKHQSELVEVSKCALDHERQVSLDQKKLEIDSIRPKFTFEATPNMSVPLSSGYTLSATNLGGVAQQVRILSHTIPHWPSGTTRKFDIHSTLQNEEKAKEKISFQDSKGNSYEIYLPTNLFGLL